MRVWRLCRPDFARKLDGEGNKSTGSRWNSPGAGVVYTSRNLSLCVLESYVHLPPELRLRLPAMAAVEIEIPASASGEMLERSDMAIMLREPDPADALRRRGDHWLKRGEKLWFGAPSLVVPQETNIMLNPAHADMSDVRIIGTEDFVFDLRLADHKSV